MFSTTPSCRRQQQGFPASAHNHINLRKLIDSNLPPELLSVIIQLFSSFMHVCVCIWYMYMKLSPSKFQKLSLDLLPAFVCYGRIGIIFIDNFVFAVDSVAWYYLARRQLCICEYELTQIHIYKYLHVCIDNVYSCVSLCFDR